MKGDFTRWTFDPKNQFTRVLMQQGRVQLDADWNEQAAILLHYLRSLAEDLIGPFGAPPNPDGTPGDGFRLALRVKSDGTVEPSNFRLLAGRYYVGGILVENPGELVYASTPRSLLPEVKTGSHLLYLDVWERHVTHIQYDSIREVALGGVDTAARAQVVWRVRALPMADTTCLGVRRAWSSQVGRWQPENRGMLKAKAERSSSTADDPCLASPEARYTGENQLYRVEIHQGGPNGTATFKWSRENGSVVFPILKTRTDDDAVTVALEHLGRDDRFDLEEGDWVELLDDDTDLRDLLKVTSVDRDRFCVTLERPGTPLVSDPAKHPFLRRWDHRSSGGALAVVEGEEDDGWVELEHGIQIQFEAATGQPPHSYRSGDYWLIPARTATGDVEWPGSFDKPEAQPPHGVEHRYAPLGLVTFAAGGAVTIKDCRTTFGQRVCVLDTGVAPWTFQRAFDKDNKTVPIPLDPAEPEPRPASIAVRNPNWSPPLLPAQWISASPDQRNADMPKATYIYELRFHLCSCFREAALFLQLMSDNSATVLLNGDPIGITPEEGHGGPPMPIDTSTGFVPGENVLRVEVQNFLPDRPKEQGWATGFVLAGRVECDRGCC